MRGEVEGGKLCESRISVRQTQVGMTMGDSLTEACGSLLKARRERVKGLGRHKALRSGGNHLKREKKRRKNNPCRAGERTCGGQRAERVSCWGSPRLPAGFHQADGHLPE